MPNELCVQCHRSFNTAYDHGQCQCGVFFCYQCWPDIEYIYAPDNDTYDQYTYKCPYCSKKLKDDGDEKE